ncbi:MAG: hypothetical protein QXQ87_02275 [Halobacteria archaeon]
MLLRVLEVCRAAEAQASDPFQVDVAALFDRLKPLLPKLESPAELRMDAEAVWRIARIVYGQGNWLQSRAALLYFDPLVTLMKIEAMGVDDLAEALGRAWRPVVEAEAVSPGQVAAGVAYWRGRSPHGPPAGATGPQGLAEPGSMERAALEEMGFAHPRAFREALRSLRAEVTESRGGDYFRLVERGDFRETVRRAYLLAHLATHGLVDLEVDAIEERVTVKPVAKPRPKGVGSSVVISLSPPDARPEGGPEAASPE